MRRTSFHLLFTALPALAAAAALSAPAPAAAQAAGRGISTLTLFVKQFGELERELAAARSGGDNAALDRLLSPVFELRRADGVLVSREDWQAAGVRKAAANVSDLAVHEAGTQAVASFRSRDAAGAEHFIVDVWVPQGEGRWQLRVRFDSPLAAKSAAKGAAPPTVDRRPDGRQ